MCAEGGEAPGADHAIDWAENEACMTSRSAWLIVAPALEERGEATGRVRRLLVRLAGGRGGGMFDCLIRSTMTMSM